VELHVARIGFDPEARLRQVSQRRAVLEWFYRDDPRLVNYGVRPADWTDRFAREDELDTVIEDKIALALTYFAGDARVVSDDPIVRAVQAIKAAFDDGIFYALDEPFVKEAAHG
jgi:hypothetical protein